MALEIEEYWGSKFPNWMVSLLHLKSLSLIRCQNCEFLPPLENLPSHESLHIEDMSKVERVGLEFLCSDTSSIQSRLVIILEAERSFLEGLVQEERVVGIKLSLVERRR
ncbi:hypothetical protein PanWU01x14_186900 [Parasponia andersonii]|uniref:R13L1/DRL21-like LRR repeat region domain-containing protein n=1 Tax=Parasponia andersonii TaxID=3476 RepID=A0A2P5C3I2_PARAD|nr:hypothetical protein PanWU01x14_186900 [Parasponia andersonii]